LVDASCVLLGGLVAALEFDGVGASSFAVVDGSGAWDVDVRSVDGAFVAASASKCRVTAFKPMSRYSLIGGGGGGASLMSMSSSVLNGVFLFRFLPLEGARWEVRWRPRGCMRLVGVRWRVAS
jgi:hypothetical protein